MTTQLSQEELLRNLLNRLTENNLQTKPGTPLAELKEAVDAAVGNLPPLKFEEFTRAIDDTEALQRLVQRAPEIVGWNADQIVAWVEAVSNKLASPSKS